MCRYVLNNEHRIGQRRLRVTAIVVSPIVVSVAKAMLDDAFQALELTRQRALDIGGPAEDSGIREKHWMLQQRQKVRQRGAEPEWVTGHDTQTAGRQADEQAQQ
ncbi:hypothetical protein D3C76_1174270 [compost metagenome]